MTMPQNLCRASLLILLSVTTTYVALHPNGVQSSLKDNSWRYGETSSTAVTNNDNQHLQSYKPTTLVELEKHYNKTSNETKHNENKKEHTDSRDMSNRQTPKVEIQKNDDDDAKTRQHNEYKELGFIVKRLNENYEYEGPGFGKNNFPGLESLSGSLRSKNHTSKKNKRRRGDRNAN